MNDYQFNTIIDEEVNDYNWSCLVVILIEANSDNTPIIDLYEKSVISANRNITAVKNLNPGELKTSILDHLNQKSLRNANFTSGLLQAISLKRYILQYKSKDLARKAEVVRGQLSNTSAAISKQDSKTKIPDSDYGSFCYFVLTKFYNPDFVLNVIKLNIPLVALFEITNNSGMIKNRLRNVAKLNLSHVEEINNFWIHFTEALNNPKNKDTFAETLFLPIKVHEIPDFSEATNDDIKGDLIYKYILLKMYLLNKKMREYIHYVNNVEVIPVPTSHRTVNTNLYDTLIESVPLECVDVEYVLHCLVEQVADYIEKENHEILQLVSNFTTINEENIYKNEEKICPQLFINHRDHIWKKTFHLNTTIQMSLRTIYTNMYSLMPYVTAWNSYPIQTDVQRLLHADLIHRLKTSGKELIPTEKFIKLLHILFFNKFLNKLTNFNFEKKMELDNWQHFSSILNNEHFVGENNTTDNLRINSSSTGESQGSKREKHMTALNNFLTYDVFDSLIQSDLMKDLTSFYYSEDLTKEVLLQALNKAYINYSRTYHEYCPLTNKLLIWFHNLYDENGLLSEIQEGILNTTVGFGDFYNHPDREIKKWLEHQRREMKFIDDQYKKLYIASHFADINLQNFSVEDINISIPFPKKEYTLKNPHKEEAPLKAFSPFGSCRCKVMEEIKTFFSSDGAKITLKKTKWLGSEEYMMVNLNSHDHTIVLYQYLKIPNSINTPRQSKDLNTIENNNYFQIQTKKGIIFSFAKKSNIEIGNKTSIKNLPVNLINETDGHYETLVTLPNGLRIELFRGKHNFVKQQFLIKSCLDHNLKQEKYRIYLDNGTVIIFMEDTSIVILYSNTTEARIKIMSKNFYGKDENCNGKEDKDKDSYDIIRHEVIGWNGQLMRFHNQNIILSKHVHKLKKAFGPSEGLYTERSDGTKCFISNKGVLTTLFPDKTITTSVPSIEVIQESLPSSTCGSQNEQNEEDEENEEKAEPFELISLNYIIDHLHYMKVEFAHENWIIHLPFGTQLTATAEYFKLVIDEYTTIIYDDETISVLSTNKSDKTKKTTSKLFLQDKKSYDFTLCAIHSSDGRAFYVNNGGDTFYKNSLNEFGKDEHSFKFFEELPLLRSKYNISTDKQFTNLSYLTNEKNYFSYTYKQFENQILNCSGINYLPVAKSVDSNVQPVILNQYIVSKVDHRFFVVNRDLSGYELISEQDYKSSLKKYETDFRTFQRFIPHATITNDITSCQTPLLKTWTQSFRTPCAFSNLYSVNMNKNELTYISGNQIWLCNLERKTTKPKISCTNKNIIVTNDHLEHPIMLLRCTKNYNPSKLDIWKFFKNAIKNFNNVNAEILAKYKNNLIQDSKSKSEIENTEVVYRKVMEKLKEKSKGNAESIVALGKGDSIKTISISETSNKTELSETSNISNSLSWLVSFNINDK